MAAHKLAMRRIADRQKNTFTPFKKGDKVWLDTRASKLPIIQRSDHGVKVPSKFPMFLDLLLID